MLLTEFWRSSQLRVHFFDKQFSFTRSDLLHNTKSFHDVQSEHTMIFPGEQHPCVSHLGGFSKTHIDRLHLVFTTPYIILTTSMQDVKYFYGWKGRNIKKAFRTAIDRTISLSICWKRAFKASRFFFRRPCPFFAPVKRALNCWSILRICSSR